MTAALAHAEPETLEEVRENLPYRLRVAARLLGRHPDTVYSHAKAWERSHPELPRAILPKAFPNSPVQVLGREILRQCGVEIAERSARTPEAGETERQRQKRADAARARLGIKPRAK